MYWTNVAISLLSAVLFLPLALSAQEGAAIPVSIRVSDPTGVGIGHAQVRLVPSPENSPANTETDTSGRLALSLKPGGYSLSVSAQAFKTWTERILVEAAGSRADASQVVSVVLQIGDVSSPTPIYPLDSLVLAAGSVHAPVALSPADFHALAHVSIRVHNGHTDASETYSGVPLATLLEKVNAPLSTELRGDKMSSFIVATGSDGYAVVLSLAEVDPSFHAGQVLVVDSRDGQPLGKNGPFQLIVSDDKRPARWVHNLVSISTRACALIGDQERLFSGRRTIKRENSSLVAAGVILRRHQNQSRSGQRGADLGGAAACLQDADHRHISREDADSNRERDGEAQNQRHEERNHSSIHLVKSQYSDAARPNFVYAVSSIYLR